MFILVKAKYIPEVSILHFYHFLVESKKRKQWVIKVLLKNFKYKMATHNNITAGGRDFSL